MRAAVDCGYPGDVTNGDIIGDDYTFRKEVTFRCDRNYALHGYGKSKCRADGHWSRPVPVCKSKLSRFHYHYLNFYCSNLS